MKIATLRCLLSIMFMLGLSGCGKNETLDSKSLEPHAPVPQQPILTSTNSNPAPIPALATASDLDAFLIQLTREVRKWIVRHQRPPQNFEEFVASAQVQIPSAPTGKKFALDKQMRVIVVNR
jgi:hypothetical protein